MKTQLFEPLTLKFEDPGWSRNPEFALLDSILESHPKLIGLLADDIMRGESKSNFGTRHQPSVEQIVRAALYMELKGLTYRQLEYHQGDSRICARFLKIDELRPYSFQVYQKYISRISSDSLHKLMVEINKIAIGEGLEDLKKLRVDSTAVESDIHYPTNNSLVWDCIKESHRLMQNLEDEITDVHYRNYLKGAKKTYYKINNTKSGNKRADHFKKQLATFTKCINQVSNALKKKYDYGSIEAMVIIAELEQLLPLMQQVYEMTERREIFGEKVANEEKLFSIYEKHTDIIVKGSREVTFGHKVNLGTGSSNLMLFCEVLRGNPSDKDLYENAINQFENNYGCLPRDSVTDGGYASKKNVAYARDKGIVNIVFNKIKGSLKNIASSLNLETRLKKWRSGIEANISNLKRRFNINRCNWKGWKHFQAKVLWSAIGYNIRVMTNAMVAQIA